MATVARNTALVIYPLLGVAGLIFVHGWVPHIAAALVLISGVMALTHEVRHGGNQHPDQRRSLTRREKVAAYFGFSRQ